MIQVQAFAEREARRSRYPIYGVLAAFPGVCFTLVLLADLAYWGTAYLMWQNFSSWLLLAGLVFGGLAALAWIIEVLTGWWGDLRNAPWPYAIAGLAALLLAFINSLVHASDGWTAVVPSGLILSVATVLATIACWWFGRDVVVVNDVVVTRVTTTEGAQP